MPPKISDPGQRTVLLLRHGKSDWDADFETDHERPLAPRGCKAAELVGRVLASACCVPSQVLTSSALRARDTVERAAKAGSWGVNLRVRRELYNATAASVLELIRGLKDQEGASVLLSGHQPTWSLLLSLMIGGGEHRFPTAALACVRFDVGEWKQVEPGRGELLWLLPPRLLEKLLED